MGIFPDVFCAGKEHTFHFLEDVLTEVIALFPSTYIHIGGDECPKIRWKACKYCQKRIRDNKLKDEQQLQSYFIHRIEKYLNSKGRQIIGWDEILEGGLAPNATVMSWRGTAGGIAAAKLGHNVVMTPGNIVYFDQAQGNSIQEPLTINGYSPLQKVYAYNPTPSNLTPQQQQRIIGVQATAWTEYMATPQKVEYMVLPRLYALSEIAWTLPSRKDYTNFLEERLPVHLARLDSSGTVYRVPKVIGLSDTTLIGGRFSFTLKSSVKGGKIYYTIDGYTPGETDYLYDKPIQIFVPEGERRVLQAVVITPGGKRSVVTKTILNNELPLAPVAARPLAKGLNYYLVPNKEFRVTAEIDTLQASEKGVTSKIDLSKFSGKGRTYGAVFTGYINIAKDGTYIFSILSDDGSALWIDGQLVLDNDQKHFAYERPSAVRLLKGFHKIEIRYFQAGGSSQLKVYMKMQGNAKEEIPAGALFH